MDPDLAAADEGTPPRSSRRLGSMIAGRRPASGPARESRAASEEKPAERTTRPRSRRAAAEDEDTAQPQVRRRRTARARDEAEESPSTSSSGRKGSPSAESTTKGEGEPDAATTQAATAETATTEAPPRRRRRTAASADEGGEVTELREALATQGQMLAELREEIGSLGNRITMSGYRPRVAVFVDVPNIIYGYEGDGSLNMGNLLDMITDGRDLVRATAYSPVSDDPREPVEQQRFVAPFVPHEYRIVTKPLKRFSDGSIKGNFDVEMAVDMVLMADRVDIITIVSGDADFARAVEVVQQKGVRVEVVAFAGSTSIEMRALADRYVELDRVIKRLM